MGRALGPAAALLACLISTPAWAQTLTVLWNPSPEPNVVAYRVFVGTSPGVYSQTFDVPRLQTSFVYAPMSAGIRYYFAVATQVSGGVWGPRSNEVSEISGGAAWSPQPPPLPNPVFSPEPVEDELPWWKALSDARKPAADEQDVQVLVSGLRPVSVLTASSEGALLVEGGDTLRVVGETGSSEVLAFDSMSGVQLEDVALDDMSFERTRAVLLLTSRVGRGGIRERAVERFRLLGGALGEGAAIVPDLPDDATRPVLALTSSGRFFSAGSAAVRAFAADGATIEGVETGSGSPLALRADPAGTLWSVIRRESGVSVERFDALSLAASSGVVAKLPVEAESAAVALQAGHARIGMIAQGRLVEFDVQTGVTALHPADLSRWGTPVHLAPSSPDGGWLVVVRQGGAAGTDALVRVGPANALMSR